MSQGTIALSNVHARRGMLCALGEELPILKDGVDAGCVVSAFARDYIQRALKAEQVLNYSGYDWNKTSRRAERLTEFTITSQLPHCEGPFLRVKRVMREDLEWNRFKAIGLAQEFNCNVQERLRFRNVPSAATSLVLGDTFKTLMSMAKSVVRYKVDGGFHLLIKEKARGPRHLEIYIGGWFNENQFPLAQYESTRIVKGK